MKQAIKIEYETLNAQKGALTAGDRRRAGSVDQSEREELQHHRRSTTSISSGRSRVSIGRTSWVTTGSRWPTSAGGNQHEADPFRAALIASFTLVVRRMAGAAGKYTKKESEITATQTALTKPRSRRPRTRRSGRRSPPTTSSAASVRRSSRSPTRRSRCCKRLIDNTNDNDPEKPDLLFRMAELYAEQYRYYDFRARELDEKIFDARQRRATGAAVSQLKAQQADYQKKSQKRGCSASVEGVPRGRRSPGQVRLVQAHGRGALLPGVHAHPGEEGRRGAQVLQAPHQGLSEVAVHPVRVPRRSASTSSSRSSSRTRSSSTTRSCSSPSRRVYGYAKYKEGWVYYNLGDFKQALATFVERHRAERRRRGRQRRRRRSRSARKRRRTRSAPTRASARRRRRGTSSSRIGGDYAMTMMEQLGELYNAQGQFQDSIKVYRNLMVLEPESPEALLLAERGHEEHAVDDRLARARPTTSRSCSASAPSTRRSRTTKALKKEQLEECRDNTQNTLARARDRLAQGSAEDQQQRHLCARAVSL